MLRKKFMLLSILILIASSTLAEEINLGRVTKQIKRHEGYRSYPYFDSTNHLTIGYGRNLVSRGIRQSEAELMLSNDITQVVEQLSKHIPRWKELSAQRKEVLISMCFNMGIVKLLEFEKMIEAIRDDNPAEVAVQMLDSKWARQVGFRAVELAEQYAGG